MSVRTRNGFLFLDFRWGKRYRISTGLKANAANHKFCDDWDAAIRREMLLGTFKIENHFPEFVKPQDKPEKQTFKDVAAAWLEAHKESWGEWTYRKHKNRLEARIFPKIGALVFEDIDAMVLRTLRGQIIGDGKLKGGKLSNRSVNRIMAPVVEIFNETFADGKLAANPAARITRLKEKRIAEIDPFTDQELADLYRTARKEYPHYADYIEHLFESGFRLEENNGLRWEKINLVTKTIAIRDTQVLRQLREEKAKTENAIRDAEITPAMERCLKRQKARSYLAYNYVWTTESGKPIDISNFRSRIWVPLLKKAPLRYRWPNQCRHTFATKHISEGKDPRWIAHQMGTSLEQLFETYTAAFNRAREGNQARAHRGHTAKSNR
jgi:integrase